MAATEPARRIHFPLQGRLIIHSDIELLTGLHIGGTPTGIEIGGMNNPIIRNPLTSQPYIPGSSLRGKLRSLLEKYENMPFNQRIDKIYIHGYDEKDGLTDVCRIFGVNSDVKVAEPTRLFVRDVTSLERLDATENDRYDETRMIEVKWEASIDRVTSAAVPRQQERVSAGLVFRGSEFVFNFYPPDPVIDNTNDYQRFEKVLLAMRLLEDDYLGGTGSRGSGKIAFTNLRFTAKPVKKDDVAKYTQDLKLYNDGKPFSNLDDVLEGLESLRAWVRQQIPLNGQVIRQNA